MAKTDVDNYLDQDTRNVYNEKAYNTTLKKQYGLTEDLITELSKEKGEPDWALDIRLKALDAYYKMENPNWGPDISYLDINNIATYVKPVDREVKSWDDVPEDIKNVFDKLGIPEAEKQALAGSGAQFDSETVYHNLSDDLKEKGIIYTSFDEALREYPDLVHEYFTKAVPIYDHKYIALHYALFSGGSFVYIPKNTKLDRPLQSYFRLNEAGAGQFEHTLIIVDEGSELQFIEGCSAPGYNELNLHAGCVELFVKRGATLRFSTIENWSKNMLNLNTKKCYVEENGKIEWIMGSFGSKVSMLYPLSVLNGRGSICEFTNISFAGNGQNLDTGLKIIHNAPNTKSIVNSKSISKDGGICTFRSNVLVKKNAINSKLALSCESLMLDSISRSDTIPCNTIETDNVEFSHEATIGKISEESIYYLMSRGLSEEDAKSLIVRGFAEPIAKAFPVEYAVEMNRLIELELEGTIG
ncbi:MAG: Fe-S cluster assembly protein SufB [Bacilli bacterium]|nr:Fe-S cluster assembly protein SufB [Bacilli bacterium]